MVGIASRRGVLSALENAPRKGRSSLFCSCQKRRHISSTPERSLPPFPSVSRVSNELIDSLHKQHRLPLFRARGDDVKILYQPDQFYQKLLEIIEAARTKLFLASLYIGKDEHELFSHLHRVLSLNPNLHLTLLLDHLRTLRDYSPSQQQQSHNSSTSSSSSSNDGARPNHHPRQLPHVAPLSHLSHTFPSQVDVRLYHTPNLRGLVKKMVPNRLNEGWGLMHSKVYGSTEGGMIISGANLSRDYFTTRQDRYFYFPPSSLSSSSSSSSSSSDTFVNSSVPNTPINDDFPLLLEYFSSLVEGIGKFSFQLRPKDLNQDQGVLSPSSSPSSSALTSSSLLTHTPPFEIIWPSTNFSPSPLISSSSKKQYEKRGNELSKQFTERWWERTRRRNDDGGLGSGLAADAFLIPMLQLPPFGIKQETELAIPRILKAAKQIAGSEALPEGGSRRGVEEEEEEEERVSITSGKRRHRRTFLDWTSGYFGMREDVKRELLGDEMTKEEEKGSRGRVRIVAASPEANGFFNSKGISYYVPAAYTHLEKQFYDAVKARGRSEEIEMREWKKDGWTYHAKGIWLSATDRIQPIPSGSSAMRDPEDRRRPTGVSHPTEMSKLSNPNPLPFLTFFGSSNYGNRSAARDLEANLLMVIPEGEGRVENGARRLRQGLGKEVENIRKWASVEVGDEMFERKDRKVGWGVKWLAARIRDML